MPKLTKSGIVVSRLLLKEVVINGIKLLENMSKLMDSKAGWLNDLKECILLDFIFEKVGNGKPFFDCKCQGGRNAKK